MAFTKTYNLALDYLCNQQQLWGGFWSWSSPNKDFFKPEHQYKTVFSNALILSILTTCPSTPAKVITQIKNKLSKFLLAQKSPSYTWNYWTRKSPEHKRFMIPDDWDDTSCALAALYKRQPKLFSGETLAKITVSLTKCELKPGGPYKTWLKYNSEAKWDNIDLVVNSNIANFLALLQVTLPNLINFIDQHIIDSNYISIYYPNVYPVLYFISRNYQGKYKSQLISHLLSLKKPYQLWSTPLATALSMSALLRLGHTDAKLQQQTSAYLKKTQNPDGSWPAEAFCCDPSLNHQPHYAGSSAITTALIMECLSLLQSTQKTTTIDHSPPRQRSIHQQIKRRLDQLEPSLRSLAKPMIKKLIKANDCNHITTLATHFYQAMNKQARTISPQNLQQLGLANFWGWLAYSIYDDLLDLQADSTLVTVANFAHRECILIYAQLMISNSKFMLHFTQLMTKIDTLELKEIINYRSVVKNKCIILPTKLPNYAPLTQIADKSIGHALGPLAILYQLNYSRYDAPVQTWLEFIYHYLTARQLNDDAHDWENDLQKGQLTPVVVKILRIIKNKQKTITLNQKTIKSLRKIFWYQVLPEITRDIKTQIYDATRALKQNPVIQNPQFFQQLLNKLSVSADQALQEQQQAIEFIQNYEKGKK